MKLTEKELKFLKDSISDIVEHSSLWQLEAFTQHGDTSCLLHSIAVTYYSYIWVKKLNIRCDCRSLVTGAMLHDYFLYDWHIPDKSHSLHGFRHPGVALRNARKIRKLNKIEENIIKRHMFPLTLVPPVYRESYIICIVDKICSAREVFCRNTYQSLKCVIKEAAGVKPAEMIH